MIDFGDGKEERMDAEDFRVTLASSRFLGVTHKYCKICHGYGFTFYTFGNLNSRKSCSECGGSGKVLKGKND